MENNDIFNQNNNKVQEDLPLYERTAFILGIVSFGLSLFTVLIPNVVSAVGLYFGYKSKNNLYLAMNFCVFMLANLILFLSLTGKLS